MLSRTGIQILVLTLCAALASAASAQQAQNTAAVNLERFERTLRDIEEQTMLRADPDIPANQRMLFEYGASVTFAFLAIDDTARDTHKARSFTLTAFAHLNMDGAHDFLIRTRTSDRKFWKDESFDPQEGDHEFTELVLDRGVYTFDLARYMAAYEGKQIDWNLRLKGGRQLVHWGNGLALSFEIDGGIVSLSFDKWTLDVLAGTSRESTTDLDSSRPGFDNDTHRDFYGGMLTYRGEKHRPFIYGFFQKDNNENESRTDLLQGNTVVTTFRYESYYIGAGSRGTILRDIMYALEAVIQGGESRSNSFSPKTGIPVPQTDDDIHAWAVDLRLDKVVNLDHRTTFSFEVLIGSGDVDRGTSGNTFNGNRPGTNDHAFNSFGYINSGLSFAPSPSNLVMVRIGAATTPWPNSKLLKRLQAGVDIFIYNKLNGDAAVDEDTHDDSFLGVEADFFVNWRLLSDVTATMRYGVFVPGPSIHGVADPRHFLYTGVTYAF